MATASTEICDVKDCNAEATAQAARTGEDGVLRAGKFCPDHAIAFVRGAVFSDIGCMRAMSLEDVLQGMHESNVRPC